MIYSIGSKRPTASPFLSRTGHPVEFLTGSRTQHLSSGCTTASAMSSALACIDTLGSKRQGVAESG